MNDNRLPMTVIGGYLGAGKTTLINQLLTEPMGKRLIVLVNDFGAINIDADLLVSANEDTLELSNGCVCCTLGSELYMAIGDVLNRSPLPDHLFIEASGIADPLKVANTAIAEPDLQYGGIVTVVDSINYAQVSDDPLIGEQVKAQVACADLLLVSKTSVISTELANRLKQNNPIEPLLQVNSRRMGELLLSTQFANSLSQSAQGAHPDYMHWSYTGERSFTNQGVLDILTRRPKALFRCKGFVRGEADQGWRIQIVGRDTEIKRIENPRKTVLVGIGLAQQIKREECEYWWEHSEASETELRS